MGLKSRSIATLSCRHYCEPNEIHFAIKGLIPSIQNEENSGRLSALAAQLLNTTISISKYVVKGRMKYKTDNTINTSRNAGSSHMKTVTAAKKRATKSSIIAFASQQVALVADITDVKTAAFCSTHCLLSVTRKARAMKYCLEEYGSAVHFSSYKHGRIPVQRPNAIQQLIN